jgi:Domain of unknown function (DUF4424)
VNNPRAAPSLAALAAILFAAPAFAQPKPAGTSIPQPPDAPTESSLVVGALQIGAAANLTVAGIDISVASDSVVYSYFLKNNGASELAVAATISLPELEANADGDETWILASKDPENPVGLTVTAGGAPVTTKAELHASALGIDRLAEIKAERLPLIPFGPELDRELAALSPDAAARLAALGLVSLRDPKEPNIPLTAAWSLDVTRSWRQVLPPGKTTPIVVKFTPVKAQYRLSKDDLDDLEDMKDDVCFKPQVLSTLQSRLKANGVWKVTDISVSIEAPSSWIDSPQPTLSVQRPKSDAIVAFCGLDEKTAGKPTALGVALDDDDNDEIRIVIFEAAK